MIEIEHDFSCPPDALWAIVGTPDRADWVPGVTEIEFADNIRRMQMAGAGTVAERIILRDPDARRLEYQVIESAAPLAHHLATITVTETDQGCRMIWTTEVQPEAVEPFIRGSMAECLEQLETLTAA